MTNLIVYRPPSTELITLSLDDSSIYVKKLMAEWNVSTTYVSTTKIDFQIGDFVTIGADNFYITRLPDVEKINKSTFRYSLVFQSVFSELQTRLNFSTDGLAEYDYTGTALDFLTNLVALVADLGWSVGTVDTTLPQNMSFSNEYCSSSLTRIAETFKLEYEIVGRAINLKKSVGTDTALSFEYGQGNGLYSITRQQVSEQNILTRVYGFGGTRNIPSDYRSRAKRLVFENRYLEKNVALYGRIDGQFTDDTIFPQRTGTLTGADINFDVADPYAFDAETSYVEDTTIDFDINAYLLKDQEAKIAFKTGDLAGIECVIIRYDNATKRIYFNAYVDPNDSYTLPRYNEGTPIQPEIGDTYTLVDIKMPQSYVDTAETALQAATQTFIDENSVPQVVYSVVLDPQYVKTIAAPKVGDRVTVVDSDLGINSLIRISGLEYPLVNPNKITATIADFVPYTLQERIIKQTINNKKETTFVDRKSALLARTNTLRQNQLKDLIFDTDNYFDTGNIRPLSIETAFISVGFKSSDFWLSNVVITTNVGGNANSMNVSAGSLVHLQISIPSVGFTWVIGTPLVATSLTPTSAYYLYAKCSKTALTGEWVLSTSQITVEQVSGYYHFYCGNLFVVADGRRDFDFVKGMTYIVGDTIKSGTIQSIDAQNYFNLTEGKFRIGNATTSLDFNVTTPDVLTLKGALVQTSAGTVPLPTFVGAYNAATTYEKGNQVTYGGSSWTWINATPASGQTPAENAYWTKSAAAGATGATGSTGPQGVAGAAGADGITYYTWIKYADTSIGGGLSDDPTGKLYIGFAHNKTTATESTTPGDYTWSLIKGDKGDTGVAGAAGANGESLYTWIKYADVADGTGLYDTPTESTLYIGIAVNKTTATESTTKTDYVWSKFKGDTGSQGIQGSAGTNGTNGTDGASLYTWLKYADTPTTGMSDSPDGKTYMGIAYNKTSPTESTTYSDYAWSLIKATDGINGVDGTTTYTWVKYGTDASGAGLNDSPTGMTYIGLAFNKTTPTESTTASDYAWSLIKGADGTNGTDGTDGISILAQGSYVDVAALIAAKGALQNGWSYYNTTDKKSYVYYTPTWYLIASDGANGENGTNGTNGLNAYFHRAWADDASGTNFSISYYANAPYIGTYSDNTVADSTDYTDYVWSVFRGADGINGTNGADGVNGTNGVSILFQGSYASVADLITAKGALQAGWSYYNTADKKSYVYYPTSWYQMTIDGVDGANGTNGTNGTNGIDGLSIVWKGDLATPPANPVENWVYRDTDNGCVYIYHGSAWDLMVLDGNDGAAGANGTNGTDGWSVYITYNDNPLGTPPASPIGDGSTGGWHTAPNEYSTWMSQKVTASITSDLYSDTLTTEAGDFITTEAGDTILVGSEGWGVPIAIKGAAGLDGVDGTDGTNGINGADGPSLVYRGLFSATVAYHYTDVNRDIVKYGDSWYLFKSKLNNNTSGAWGDGSRWEIFGGSFESIATGLLFAAEATIPNLVAEKVRTASSGARVEVNYEGTQKIKILDSSDDTKILITPDDIQTVASIVADTGSPETEAPTAWSLAIEGGDWDYPATGEGVVATQKSDAFSPSTFSAADVLKIEVSNITLSANVTIYSEGFTTSYGTSKVSVWLQKEISSVWTNIQLIGECTDTEATAILPTVTVTGQSIGNYRLVAVHYHTWGAIELGDSVTTESAWAYTTGAAFGISIEKTIAQTQIGSNGLCSATAADNFIHFNEDGLNIRGNVNMPGILGSGSSSSSGTLTNVIGKLTGVTKDSTGNYTITHGLGFSTYMAMITPITSNAKLNPVIVSKSTNSFAIKIVDASNDTATDTAFDILIIGNNV